MVVYQKFIRLYKKYNKPKDCNRKEKILMILYKEELKANPHVADRNRRKYNPDCLKSNVDQIKPFVKNFNISDFILFLIFFLDPF